MARKKKTSGAEDFIALFALLPWWVSLALAGLAYVLLHRYVTQPITVPAAPGRIGELVGQTLWRSFASAGQYLLPLMLLISAGLSAFKRHERRQLLQTTTQNPSADAVNGMTWQQFELLVGESFRQQGYRVTENGGGGADGGIDLVLHKAGETYLVQCKQWRAFKVGVEVVRELYGLMAARGAAGGFVVTSGTFTAEATKFASGRNVHLVDGVGVQRMLQGTRAPRPTAAPPVQAPNAAAPLKASAEPADVNPPPCPSCARPMVRRRASRGAHAGRLFWGCSGYPTCRGTLRIDETRANCASGE